MEDTFNQLLKILGARSEVGVKEIEKNYLASLAKFYVCLASCAREKEESEVLDCVKRVKSSGKRFCKRVKNNLDLWLLQFDKCKWECELANKENGAVEDGTGY